MNSETKTMINCEILDIDILGNAHLSLLTEHLKSEKNNTIGF